MAATKKKRKMSPAQKAALAKGRKALAAKRKSGGTAKRKTRKTATAKRKAAPKRKTAARKTAKRKTVKRSNPTMARKKRKSGGGFRKKARRAAGRARGFLKAAGAKDILMEAGTAVAGGIAAGFIANKLPIADARIKAAMPIVGGMAIAATIGKKNKIARGIGTGMVVLGTVSIIKQFAPNIPMLAGEDELMLIPDYGALPYAGEMVDLGEDEYDDESIATMGEMVDLGEDEPYLSPASF